MTHTHGSFHYSARRKGRDELAAPTARRHFFYFSEFTGEFFRELFFYCSDGGRGAAALALVRCVSPVVFVCFCLWGCLPCLVCLVLCFGLGLFSGVRCRFCLLLCVWCLLCLFGFGVRCWVFRRLLFLLLFVGVVLVFRGLPFVFLVLLFVLAGCFLCLPGFFGRVRLAFRCVCSCLVRLRLVCLLCLALSLLRLVVRCLPSPLPAGVCPASRCSAGGAGRAGALRTRGATGGTSGLSAGDCTGRK